MYLYPKWIRVWHVLNAMLFLIIIVTGLSMQYTDKARLYSCSWICQSSKMA